MHVGPIGCRYRGVRGEVRAQEERAQRRVEPDGVQRWGGGVGHRRRPLAVAEGTAGGAGLLGGKYLRLRDQPTQLGCRGYQGLKGGFGVE